MKHPVFYEGYGAY